ncbi:hypothetical protein G6F37_002397 [Rhizopus arrhizus]|nr:hypothetical protein G6F38_000832 [Rhizopus arrhizus]KAG1162171.1 hypothetical protein G6F37_002397 [Rhizopus arrhizus]
MSLESLEHEIAFELLNLAGETKQVQWNSFLEKMSQCIINNYKGGSTNKYQTNWKKAFKENAKKLGLKIVRDTLHNDVWTEKIVTKLKPSIIVDSNSSASTSTSSLQYQTVITEKDKTLMKHMYDKLSGKWVLKSGVVVEDAIYNEAKDYSVEHPLHSYVLHVNDSKLTDMFKPEEMKEIEEESEKADLMKALPESLASMLMNLDGKNDFDSNNKAFQGISCNRRQQPEEYWCRESVLNYLNLFIDKDSVSSFPTEQDLLQDMYGFTKATKHIIRLNGPPSGDWTFHFGPELYDSRLSTTQSHTPEPDSLIHFLYTCKRIQPVWTKISSLFIDNAWQYTIHHFPSDISAAVTTLSPFPLRDPHISLGLLCHQAKLLPVSYKLSGLLVGTQKLIHLLDAEIRLDDDI